MTGVSRKSGGRQSAWRPFRWFIPITAAALLALPVPVCAHTGHGHDSVAETELRIALELNPNDLISRNRLGTILSRKNRFDQAEREYAAVLKLAPDNVDAHVGMGIVRLQAKKPADAVSWFQRAIKLDPDQTLPHYHLSLAYEGLGMPLQAQASLNRALAVNRTLLRRGINRQQEQEYRQMLEAARESFRKRHKAAGRR